MRLLILSDIHGNWPALEAVLAAEPARDAVVFCGDVVDYGPQPLECLHWLAENAEHVVRGNHDNALAFDMDCRCMGAFREYSVATRAWHRGLLNPTDIEFLHKMPTRNWFDRQDKHFRMAHATPQGGMFEYIDMDQWGARIVGLEADFVLLGHTHVQGLRTFGRFTVVNPGSVGLARDHRGKACYAVYEEGRMELKQIPYAVGRTAALLRAAPLSDRVIEGLVGVLGYEG
ncbi:MAG: metallophosphoesterase family protein [Thermoguttaceae bacterium]